MCIRDRLEAASIELLLSEIKRLAATPAIYLFGINSLYGLHSVERTIQNEGFRRLATTLMDASKHTKIVSVSSVLPSRKITSDTKINNPTTYELQNPKVSDLQTYVSKKSWRSLVGYVENEEHKVGNSKVFFNREIEGRHLQIIATIISINPALIQETVEHIKQLSHDLIKGSKNNQNTLAEHEDELVSTIIKTFLGVQVSKNCRRAMYLLLASQDGLVETSIKDILLKWANMFDEGPPNFEEIKNFLQMVNIKSKNRVLTITKNARLADNEITYNERQHLIEDPYSIPTYTMDNPIRTLIADMLLSSPEDVEVPPIKPFRKKEFRRANLFVAASAYKRALISKENSDYKYGMNLEDLRRNLQVITNGLLSISLEDFQQNKLLDKNVVNLTLESPLNSHNPKSIHNARQRFLYLFRYIFRLEIDFDNRLTTSLDEDKVRLELLLMFWKGVGKRFSLSEFSAERSNAHAMQHNETVNNFKQLILGELPIHIVSSLDADEISYYLLSISVAAHHANHHHICIEATSLLEQHKEKQKRLLRNLQGIKSRPNKTTKLKLHPELHRAVFNWTYAKCHVVKSVLLGYNPPLNTKSAEPKSRLSLFNEQLNGLNLVKKEATAFIPEKSKLLLIAKRNIVHKQLQITRALNLDMAETIKLLDEHVEIQKQLSEITPDSTQNILSFFSLHFAESLLGDCFLDDVRDDSNIIDLFDERLKSIFKVTIMMHSTRLSRYLGSERLALMTTSAWYYFRRSKPEIAMKKINSVKIKAASTDISYGMRASIDWAMVQMNSEILKNNESIETLEKVLKVTQALNSYSQKAGLIKYRHRSTLMWAHILLTYEKMSRDFLMDTQIYDETIDKLQGEIKAILANPDQVAEPLVIRKAKQIDSIFNE